MGPIESLLRLERLRRLGPVHDKRVLDIGCGSGEVWCGCVADQRPLELIGVEPDESLRALAAATGAFARVGPVVLPADVRQADVVVAMGVLEHVDDPMVFLEPLIRATQIFVTVPNADSFHRWVGLELGLLSRLDELQAHDHAIGHQRYFGYDSFRAMLNQFCAASGHQVTAYGTLGFKVGSNSQMVQLGTAATVFSVANQLGLAGIDARHGSECYAKLTLA